MVGFEYSSMTKASFSGNIEIDHSVAVGAVTENSLLLA